MNNFLLLGSGLVGSLIVGLIAYAITTMVKYTDGPLDIFKMIRILVRTDLPVIHPIPALARKGIVTGYIEDDEPTEFLAKLFKCYWCLTTWISLFISILTIIAFKFPFLMLFLVWFASIGVSGFLHSFSEG